MDNEDSHRSTNRNHARAEAREWYTPFQSDADGSTNRNITVETEEREWHAAFQQVANQSAVAEAFSHGNLEVRSKTLAYHTIVKGKVLVVEATKFRILQGPMEGKETVELKVKGTATALLALQEEIHERVLDMMPSVYEWMNSEESRLPRS